MHRPTIRSYTAIACLGVALGSAQAQNIDRLISESQNTNQAARASQQRIDQVVDQTRDIAAEYSAVVKEIDGLNVYNQLLQKQVDAQNRELQTLETSMDQVTVIERQVIPLMTRMIDGLDTFIQLDVPFLADERNNRVNDLRNMMERADVTAAEKFRRVMEAYQIESEYGKTIEAYRGVQTIDGTEREVDFLRIGRVGLYYQTPDTVFSGMYDIKAGQWIALGDSERAEIRDGLKVARKQTAPDLLTLPVPAPEGA